jgi:lipooligosaccharide transport system permease protein
MNLSYRFYYVWRRNLAAYKRFVIPTLLISLGEPFFYLIAMGLGLGAYMGLFGGQSYIHFLASGLVIASVMMTSTFECLYDSYVRMVLEKIWDALIATPLLAEDIIAGDIVWGTFRGVISGFLMYTVAVLLGVLPVSLPIVLTIFCLMVLIGILFGSMAMIVTSFAPSFDFFNYYTELVVSPIFFFSGVFFPLDKMPEWIKFIANLFPLTHAVVIVRATFDDQLNSGHWLNLLAIIVPMMVAFYLALFFMKRRLIK